MNNKIIKPLEPGETVILANGLFPVSMIALRYLEASAQVICCDGAVKQLVQYGKEPALIIGDLDSIEPKLRNRFSDRIIELDDQETNDLTKAIEWATDKGIERTVVLGADGKRIDHTIANAALIAEHCGKLNLMMATNEGFMLPVQGTATLPGKSGLQVSIFSLTPATRYTSTGLKYPLAQTPLSTLLSGSLHEMTGDSFTIAFEDGWFLIFLNLP